MSKTRNVLAGVMLAALFASPASAWNAMGHRVVAEIAWRKLDPADQAAIVDILRQHPRFSEDFVDRMESSVEAASTDVQDNWIFCQAATWPDIARGTSFDRPLWHYINLPVFLSSQQASQLAGSITVNTSFKYPTALAETKLNGVQAVKRNFDVLTRSSTDDEEKAVAYCWLLHVIGDLHQPLHTSALFTSSMFPGGDHGGNKISIKRDTGSSHPQKLHAVWDGLLGKSSQFNAALSKSQALITEYPTEFAMPFVAVPDDVWTTEVQQLALNDAYGPLLADLQDAEDDGHGVQVIEVPQSYYQKAGKVAGRQAVIAGVRLAGVLKAALATQPSPGHVAAAPADFAIPVAIARGTHARTRSPLSRPAAPVGGNADLLERVERLERLVEILQAQQPLARPAGAVMATRNSVPVGAAVLEEAQCDCGEEE